MKYVFIINPVAGDGKKVKILKEIELFCQSYNMNYIIKVTENAKQTEEIARMYSKDKENIIIYSVGGDGTLNNIINGLYNTKNDNLSFGVIPTGSGNDYYRNLADKIKIGLSLTNYINPKAIKTDVGIVNNKSFINVASIGLDAKITYNADNKTKLKKNNLVSPKMKYYLNIYNTIMEYKPEKVEIEISNNIFKKEITMLTVCNGKYYGGGICIAPDALINDGLFDVCIVDKVTKLKMVKLLISLIKKEHMNENEVNFYRSDQLIVKSDKPMIYNMDGQIEQTDKLEFNILKKRLNVVVPKQKNYFYK